MFVPFKTDIQTINTLARRQGLRSKSFAQRQQRSKEELRRILHGQNGVVNGSYLQSFYFPTDNDGFYDVFISHSHNDLQHALLLATWLEDNCGLRCFVDHFVWGSADDLLKEIDDEYCMQSNGALYNYEKRNFSTSHVHAMLSMAILDVIDKTECSIFIESCNSLDLSGIGTKTLSPWLYEEITMMKRLRQRIPNRYQGWKQQVRSFSTGARIEMLNEARQLKVSYNIDVSRISNLDTSDFLRLENQGTRGLDNTYRNKGILRYG